MFQEETKRIHIFIFSDWPDKGVPPASVLLSFRRRVKKYQKFSKGPVLVQCE